MTFVRRIPPTLLTLALLAWPVGGVAWSDDAPRPPGVVPVEKPAPGVADRKGGELPRSALGYEDSKPKLGTSGEDQPGSKLPNKFQFGDNTLHLDAERKNQLPPGVDDNKQAIMNRATPSDSPLPRYFGLRITTPIK